MIPQLQIVKTHSRRHLAALAMAALVMLLCATQLAFAQALVGLARVDAQRSSLSDGDGLVRLQLGLSQPVPYRVFTLDAPFRLVLDFSVLDWQGLDAEAFNQSETVTEIRIGTFRPEWTRMVVMLDAPLKLASVQMRTDGPVDLQVALQPTSAEEFAALSGAPPNASFTLPEPVELDAPRSRPNGDRPVMVVLDPGHGGLDPGAVE